MKKLDTIQFEWHSASSIDILVLHDKTLEQAIKEAKLFGFKERKWYKPWTWNNSYLVKESPVL